MRTLLPVLVGFFAACTTSPAPATSTEGSLVAAAREEVERQIAADGHVDRFLVFLDAAGTTELGGIDGGGDGPGGGDVLRAMMERGHFTAAADITYPRSGNPFRVETMLVTYLDALGVEREVTVRLPKPAIRALRFPR